MDHTRTTMWSWKPNTYMHTSNYSRMYLTCEAIYTRPPYMYTNIYQCIHISMSVGVWKAGRVYGCHVTMLVNWKIMLLNAALFQMLTQHNLPNANKACASRRRIRDDEAERTENGCSVKICVMVWLTLWITLPPITSVCWSPFARLIYSFVLLYVQCSMCVMCGFLIRLFIPATQLLASACSARAGWLRLLQISSSGQLRPLCLSIGPTIKTNYPIKTLTDEIHNLSVAND